MVTSPYLEGEEGPCGAACGRVIPSGMARRRRTGAQGQSPACIRNKDTSQLMEGRTSRSKV